MSDAPLTPGQLPEMVLLTRDEVLDAIGVLDLAERRMLAASDDRLVAAIRDQIALLEERLLGQPNTEN